MTFEDFSRMFPRGETIVGNYFYDGEELPLDIEQWKIDPFKPIEGSITFLLYIEHRRVFQLWYFSYDVVCGYYTEDGKGWSIVICTESEGCERYNPFSDCEEALVLEPPQERDMAHQVARLFDPEMMDSGYVFTNMEEVQIFLTNTKSDNYE